MPSAANMGRGRHPEHSPHPHHSTMTPMLSSYGQVDRHAVHASRPVSSRRDAPTIHRQDPQRHRSQDASQLSSRAFMIAPNSSDRMYQDPSQAAHNWKNTKQDPPRQSSGAFMNAPNLEDCMYQDPHQASHFWNSTKQNPQPHRPKHASSKSFMNAPSVGDCMYQDPYQAAHTLEKPKSSSKSR